MAFPELHDASIPDLQRPLEETINAECRLEQLAHVAVDNASSGQLVPLAGEIASSGQLVPAPPDIASRGHLVAAVSALQYHLRPHTGYDR